MICKIKYAAAIILALFVFLNGVSKCQIPQYSDQELRDKLHELDSRILAKDYTAFSEAVDLPGERAVRFIWPYVLSATVNPETQPRAMEAIKRVHGFKADMRKKIAAITDQEMDPTSEFRILVAIGNREAAEIIAPYLFDFRFRTDDGKTLVGDAYNILAAGALSAMHFADPPTLKSPTKYGPAEHIAWQKWSATHGLVPKEWISLVGVPEWQYRREAERQKIDFPHGMPPANQNEQSLSQTQDPSQTARVRIQGSRQNTGIRPTGDIDSRETQAEQGNHRKTLSGRIESDGLQWICVGVGSAIVAAWLVIRNVKHR